MSTRSCSECQGLWPPLDCQGVGLIYGPLRDCLGDDTPDGTALPPPVLWHIQVNMGNISYTNIWRSDAFHHCIAVFSNLCSKGGRWKAERFSCINKILPTSFQGNCNIHGKWLRGAAMCSSDVPLCLEALSYFAPPYLWLFTLATPQLSILMSRLINTVYPCQLAL